MSGLHQTGFIWFVALPSLAAGISPHPVESRYLQKWLAGKYRHSPNLQIRSRITRFGTRWAMAACRNLGLVSND